MKVREGDLIALISRDGPTRLVHAGDPVREGDKVIPTSGLIGRELGDRVTLLGVEFTIATHVWHDAMGGLTRGPQIIAPEASVQIAHLAGIAPGSNVVEGGTGSGSATIALASLVGDTGHVHTYDRNAGSSALARSNAEGVEMGHRITFHACDVSECDVEDADALVLDLPEPWVLLDTAQRVLRPGGFLIAYVPTTTQAERMMRATPAGFGTPRCHETIHREWVLSKAGEGIRPTFKGPAHTGFLVAMRRI